MEQVIYRALMNTVPTYLIDRGRIKIGRQLVKSVLSQSSNGPSRLDRKDLEFLLEKYRDRGIGFDGSPTIGRSVKTVPDTLVTVNTRGKNAANEIISMVQAGSAKDFLEIGCREGQVAGFLATKGLSVTGIDLNGDWFNPKYVEYGANLVVGDATIMPFQDESFDFVYSYDTFEHITDLDSVLSEVYRVLRHSGYLYAKFGPLYSSPWGLHAAYAVPIPYCQFLFERETLDDYVAETGQYPIRYNELNGWSLNQYRKLLIRYGMRFKRVKYREWSMLKSLDLVRKYPKCFRGRVDHIDDLYVASIQVLFQKMKVF